MAPSSYLQLCNLADARGAHVGLVAGPKLHIQLRPDGGDNRWRDIIALEVRESDDRVKVAPMKGIDDLERAATSLL